MMNRQITQWHNPRDCSAACARVENVMKQLKSLARSIEEEEDGYRPQKLEIDNSLSIKQQELPCQPMPGHYRYPEPGPPPVPCCGKRNGLQDYCGVMGPECYMNPKAIATGIRSYGMGQERTYPYQRETNKLRCDASYGGAQGGQRGACFGKDCINDFYLIPAEPNH